MVVVFVWVWYCGVWPGWFADCGFGLWFSVCLWLILVLMVGVDCLVSGVLVFWVKVGFVVCACSFWLDELVWVRFW